MCRVDWKIAGNENIQTGINTFVLNPDTKEIVMSAVCIHMYACMYICLYLYMYWSMYTCIYVPMYVYVCMYVYIPATFIFICMLIYVCI